MKRAVRKPHGLGERGHLVLGSDASVKSVTLAPWQGQAKRGSTEDGDQVSGRQRGGASI